MSGKACRRCGRELTKIQRWNKKKYCSRECFYDTRYGERIEWNGVWIRPGQALETLKLCQQGLSESEARKVAGANFKAIRRIRNTPELAVFLPECHCLFCGKSLEKSARHKYCSKSCKGKARYDRRRAAAGLDTRRIDDVKRNRAIELFSRGLDCGSIARYLELPIPRIRSWAYARPIKRAAVLSSELIPLLPLKHRLTRAKSAAEWKNALHGAAGSFGTPGQVVLVTETLHGGGAPGRYAAIVMEKLKQTVTEGASFAFCNVLRNAVTVLSRENGNWSLSRVIKSSGTFLWPGDHLGDCVTVTQAAFSYLVSYQRNAKTQKKHGRATEKP